MLSPFARPAGRPGFLPAALLCTAFLAAPSGAQDAAEAPMVADPRPRQAVPAPLLPHVRAGLGDQGPAGVRVLPELDADAFLDSVAGLPNGPQISGLVMPVGLDARADGSAWLTLPDGGLLWWIEVVSPGAVGLRLRLADAELPAGAELWVHDGAGGPAASGPGAPGAAGWTAVVDGERAWVELLVPAGTAAPAGVTIAEALVMARNGSAPVGGGGPPPGSCHVDVLCHPEWHPLHEATVRIDSIDGSTGLLCTATLLATSSGDLTPYLLTAAHCVSGEGTADTLAARFFFESEVCGGVEGPWSTASAADVVAVHGVYDMTLVLLHGVLPAGVVWAGWTTVGIADGQPVATIQHPGGGPKKIALGTKITSTFSNPAVYYGVTWTEGTIEGNSSGSGLFRSSTQLLVGVASHSSLPLGCTNPDGPSGYGKFKEWYADSPALAALVGAGSDDGLEPNGACASAAPLPIGVTTGLVVKLGDEDWYGADIGSGGSLSVTLTSTPAFGDVDLELYDACDGTLLAAASGSDASEMLSWSAGSATTGSILLRVFLADDLRADYALDVTLDAGDPGFLFEGPGLAGSLGVPALGGLGDLSPGGAGYSVTVSGAPPFAAGFLFVSLAGGALPFKGGTFYPLPIDAEAVVPMDGSGSLTLADVMDAGVPSGASAVLQYWFADAGGPLGASASDGLRLVVP